MEDLKNYIKSKIDSCKAMDLHAEKGAFEQCLEKVKQIEQLNLPVVSRNDSEVCNHWDDWGNCKHWKELPNGCDDCKLSPLQITD